MSEAMRGNGSVDIQLDVSGIQRIMREAPEKVNAFLRWEGAQVVADVVQAMTDSPANGEVYTRGSVSHVASSAGNAPRVDTGTLRASIRMEEVSQFEIRVMDGVEYGIYLEDGTEHIAPRPFMRPAFERLRRRFASDARSRLDLK